MRRATAAEIAKWDELIKQNSDGGNVLQGRALAETKAKFGWTPEYFVSEKIGVAFLVLTRKVTGIGEIWYIPKGPGVADVAALGVFIEDLKSLDGKPVLVKIEPELALIDSVGVEGLGLNKVRDLQFNVATVIVDLKPSEEEILASFRQKTRYNVRLAEKHGVKVEAAACNAQSIDQMYGLMESTRDRAGFYLRSKDYFAKFWTEHVSRGCGQYFFASYEGQILGGVFAAFLGPKALYKDGGSIREHSNLQAPYLLQWEVMRWLKAHGVTEYDLHGTPPADQIDNDQHPLYSLGRFKTGFNAEVTEYVGTWDLPLDSAKYALWVKYGERAAQVYAHRVKKQLFY